MLSNQSDSNVIDHAFNISDALSDLGKAMRPIIRAMEEFGLSYKSSSENCKRQVFSSIFQQLISSTFRQIKTSTFYRAMPDIDGSVRHP